MRLARFPLLAAFLTGAFAMFAAEPPVIEDPVARLAWKQTAAGWQLDRAVVRAAGGDMTVGTPSGEYTLLYSATAPEKASPPFPWAGGTQPFPEPQYRFTAPTWREATTPVALNRAGEVHRFFPATATALAGGGWTFRQSTEVADVEAEWRLDPAFPGDVGVTMTLTARRAGYFSLATPTLTTIAPAELAWGMVPGYFQGASLNPDLVLALAYGHGLPALPVVVRERTATTLAPLVTHRSGATVAVVPEPGTAADPWDHDKDTRARWRLGLSHMNRAGALAPTLYHPVLGEDDSKLAAGEKRTLHFRYVLRAADWFAVVSHAARDIYRLDQALALKQPQRSLSERLMALQGYVTDDRTSLWRTEQFGGRTIGAQAYNGAVVGSDHDAMKNSDYGAMWMLGRLTGDPRLTRDRLPFARAFKLAQQEREPGFFEGAAAGQYYLSKSRRFTEEWGDYVEPTAVTYYTMLDLGNILLFEPGDAELRAALRRGADRLLAWQHPDGHWEVGYDRATAKPMFTDLPDVRPTFYGLLVAYRILGDARYLAAARRGADWLVRHAVEPGRFVGVCGDNRFAPDFATAQIAQALLDLHAATGDARYRAAAITTARYYVTSVYTHPLATAQRKRAGGAERPDWAINQTGLGFEHGGAIGSANRGGPILLASHAGLFVRLGAMTGEPIFQELARAGALAREAFVDPATSVASYYWARMNAGAGPFPHHAWWQIGWITDYLLAEAEVRSGGAIAFPRGFFTPKVGPHASFGFAPGKLFGTDVELAWGRAACTQPEIDSIVARGVDGRKRFTVLLNDSARATTAVVSAASGAATLVSARGERTALAATDGAWRVPLPAWGLAVVETAEVAK